MTRKLMPFIGIVLINLISLVGGGTIDAMSIMLSLCFGALVYICLKF